MAGPRVIVAIRTVGLPPRSRHYPAGRQCSHPGCETWLSIYNRASTCAVHSPRAAPRLRGRKPREAAIDHASPGS